MSKTFTFDIDGITVEVTRKSVKNMNLRIKPNCGVVYMSVPLRTDMAAAQDFALSKTSWIKKHLSPADAPQRTVLHFEDGELVPVWGRSAVLRLCPDGGREYAEISKDSDGVWTVFLHIKENSTPEHRQDVLMQWYRDMLEKYIALNAPKWESITGAQASEWRIKRMKTRWGTCNTACRRIWLNSRLAMLPSECVDYIMVHELCHIFEPSHDRNFKALLDRFYPRWREIKKDMSTKGGVLQEPVVI